MKIGFAYDLKTTHQGPQGVPDEEEEYDPPDTIDALAAEIERLGHQVVHLGGGSAFLDAIRRIPVDFVFNIAEGRGAHRSREAQIPSVLEMLGIPYAGSDPLTLALCLDKPSAKSVALSAGIPTPPYLLIEQMDDLKGACNGSLTFPVVVKPAFEGSSKGINGNSRVDRQEDLEQPVRQILQRYRQPALVEQFVPGMEVTVGLVGNNPPEVVAVMEVAPRTGPDENFMYTLDVKRNWQQTISYRCPPLLPASCVQRIEALAGSLFKLLGCRDLARLDFRVAPDERVYFLEANPLPGLSPQNSDLPLMASLSGWSYSQLIETILNVALARCGLLELSHAHRSDL